MSAAAALERLAAARAFKPMEAFDELADNHVDFDELLGGRRREAALAKALQGTTPAPVAVLENLDKRLDATTSPPRDASASSVARASPRQRCALARRTKRQPRYSVLTAVPKALTTPRPDV